MVGLVYVHMGDEGIIAKSVVCHVYVHMGGESHNARNAVVHLCVCAWEAKVSVQGLRWCVFV